MHRLGFEGFEIDMLCDMLEENRYIRVESVFSHLVASEAPSMTNLAKSRSSVLKKLLRR
jgi:alanine racemase